MSLNLQQGNMYGWLTATCNPFGGACPFDCAYCYRKKPRFKALKKYQGQPRLVESELKCSLYKAGGRDIRGGIIFVGSMIDISCLPRADILAVLDWLKLYPDNWYLLQTKNPKFFLIYREYLPERVICATTIETTESVVRISNAPAPAFRAMTFAEVQADHKLVSIEPALWFHLPTMIQWLRMIKPTMISIGGLTGMKYDGCDFRKPYGIWNLVREFLPDAKILLKKNLQRVLGTEMYDSLVQEVELHEISKTQAKYKNRLTGTFSNGI